MNMRKLFLGVLVAVMMLSIVSAADLTITNPVPFQNVSGTLNVQWSNPTSAPGYYLQYHVGNCNPGSDWITLGGPFDSSITTYAWNTLSGNLSDGQYCLRLQLNEITGAIMTNTFTIDNTPPTAAFNFNGKQTVWETISFDGSASTDGTGSGIVSYSWNFGDGNITTTSTSTVTHVYSNPKTYNVVLTVTDNAGNVGTVTHSVAISAITYTNSFSFDAVIKGVQNLSSNFNTGLSGLTSCTDPSYSAPTSAGLNIANNATHCLLTWDNIPYSAEGTYTFPVRTTNRTDVKYFSVTVNAYAWMIPLAQGWNVFSIPLMPNDPSLTGVLGGIKNNIDKDAWSVFQYDAVNGVWDKTKPTNTGWSSSGTLSRVVPGYAYGINMDNADTLKGFGYLNPIGGLPLSAEVANGWNLIGQYGYGTLSLWDALSSLRLGITRYYDAVYDADTNLVATSMERFNGYWMSAKFLPNGIAQYTASSDAIKTISP